MARPRKDAAGACARTRLIEAFWDLLEDTPVRDITVGAIVERVGCNRGTFYYHFADMDALVTGAVTELLADGALSRALFRTLAGANLEDLTQQVPRVYLERVTRIMRAGELQQVELAIRRAVQELWRSRLAPTGELEPASTFAIQFMVGGMLGFLIYHSRTGAPLGPLPPEQQAYLTQVARATVEAVAHAQHLRPREVVARVLAR